MFIKKCIHLLGIENMPKTHTHMLMLKFFLLLLLFVVSETEEMNV